MKAVTHGFPYTVTVVENGNSYANLRGNGAGGSTLVLSGRRDALVIEGDEVTADVNLNGTVGSGRPAERGPGPDTKLVMFMPEAVIVATAPPASLNGFTTYPPGPIQFASNGQADLTTAQMGSNTPNWVLYLTTSPAPTYYAVTVWHSGPGQGAPVLHQRHRRLEGDRHMKLETRTAPPASRDDRGFSLIETLIAMFILAVAIIALANLFLLSIRKNARSAEQARITQAAQEKLRSSTPTATTTPT